MALISRSSALASQGERLTGKSPADDIDWLEILGSNGSHVSMPGSAGPVFFKDFATELILFNLP
jgi:hypothetical protein